MCIDKLIDENTIKTKVQELASKIRNDLKTSDNIILVGLLRGSIVFMADLLRAINIDGTTVDFMFVSSYGNSKKSSGNVKIIKDLEENIENKDVIIVEDIIDTGLTLEKVVSILQQRKPKSIKICTLLSKTAYRKSNIKIDYIGFEIDDYFVVGYGIDYNQKYRNLPYIGFLKSNKK